jgi:predicted dehydrogenase
LLQNAQVVANSDLDYERADSAGRRYGVERSYTDYHEMLQQEKPDGVIVCVAADFHARTAIELMQAGYHVYTEKAPALDLAQCRQMLQTHVAPAKFA